MIYTLEADGDRYRSLTFVHELDSDKVTGWNTLNSIQAEWTPIQVEFFNEEDDDRLPVGDVAGFLGVALTKHAVKELKELLRPFGEFLPLRHIDGMEYNVYHVTNTCDCLDAERSQVSRTRNGIIIDVQRYAFKSEMIDESQPLAFRVPELAGDEFVNSAMRDAILETGLTGFKFAKVWP